MPMDSTEIVFAIAIMILYPFFFGKLANYIFDKKETGMMCVKQDFDSPCYKTRDELLRKEQLKKHIMLVLVAIIGLVVSGMIGTKTTKVGLSVGGLITLIWSLTIYWHRYEEGARIAILGASFIFMIWLSTRLYQVKNISDVFAIEFGTKNK